MAEIKNNKTLAKLGDNIRSIRIKKGFNQQEFSCFSGFNVTQLCKMEKGLRNISVMNLLKISSALNVSLNELFEGI